MDKSVVDLSNETVIKNESRKLDRKRFTEIKKYIPFLQYITAVDPVKNKKYIQLLQYISSNKIIPAKHVTPCDIAINKRYKFLRSSMVFPPHIVSIFEGGDEAIDLISDDEQFSLSSNNRDNVVTLISPEIGEKNQHSKNVDNNGKSLKNLAVEDGELCSDIENVSDGQNERRKRNVSLSEISLKELTEPQLKTSIASKDDDLINQDLFNRIDNLSKNTVNAINKHESESKYLEKETSAKCKSTINLKTKTHKRVSPHNMSNTSDDDETVPHNKKKKKRKRQKKHQNGNGSCSGSESENFQSEKHKIYNKKQTARTKSNNNSKKINEKRKITRPFIVSDDEDNQSTSQGNCILKAVKGPESELFQRRKPSKGDNIYAETSVDKSETVLLLDSDEEAEETSPTGKNYETSKNINLSEKDTIEPQGKNLFEEQNQGSQLNKQETDFKNASIPNKMKGLKNMDLSELNDIYAKLCEKTGIQLEELLCDLVAKSSLSKEDQLKTKVQSINSSSNNNYSANSTDNVFYDSHNNIVSNDFHKQQNIFIQNQHLHQQQPNNLYQRQQYCEKNEHFQGQAQPSNNHILNNNPLISNTYQNSLLPKLNLNDPRIVQKLKQIKDSPIHNLHIRTSATLLMNNYSQFASFRNQQPLNKVSSSTATTYGEHKRLKELEKTKQKEKEQENRSETFDLVSNMIEQNCGSKDTSELSEVEVSSNRKRTDSSVSEISTKEVHKHSSGSEKTNQFKMKNSLKSESTNETPKSPKKYNTDVENVSKHSSTSESVSDTHMQNKEGTNVEKKRSNSRPRIDSNSSSSTNDTVDFQQKTLLNNTDPNIQKVVNIVISALTEKGLTLKPSKYRRTSLRKSTDSVRTCLKSLTPVNTENTDTIGNKQNDVENSNRSSKNNCKRPLRKSIDESNKSSKKGKRSWACRELENLNCTFKEYNDIFEKCLLPNKDGKRLCVSERQTKNTQNYDSENSEISSFSGNCNLEKAHDKESDETDEFDIEEHRHFNDVPKNVYRHINNDPFNPCLRVTLTRISETDVKKWINEDNIKLNETFSSIFTQKTPSLTNTVYVNETPEQEIPILVPITSKPVSGPKKISPKNPAHLNNDLNMTLNSTKSCVLCKKRPVDLTNHYVVQHQIESYTSRLTSKKIKNIEENIPIAVRYRNRYKLTCIFCEAELEDYFVNFHAHFSFHTGEFGFKCGTCDLVKPYREDIRSHQYRTTACLNGKIRSNYLYSPDLVVIYLYICKICNFVQLNEANIQKHQREHHNIRLENPNNVKKVIIAAVDNSKICNEVILNEREEDEPTSSEKMENRKPEQEFLDENPLDIKDFLSADQEHASISQHDSIKKLLQDIEVDEEKQEFLEKRNREPKSLTSNIITVIHSTNEKHCQDDHRPLMEPLDKKPTFKEVQMECSSSDTEKVKLKMVYRQISDVSKYFGLYKCSINDCWFSSNHSDRYIQHVLSIHSKEQRNIFFDCAYCIFKCTKAENMAAHVFLKHVNCRYQCAECAYRSTIPGNVALHRRVNHKNSNLDKGIIDCSSRSIDLNERLADLKKKMIENVSILKCKDCSTSFYAVYSIKSHIQMEHPLTFKKLDFTVFPELVCLHCTAQFYDKDIMRMHMAIHHPDEIAYVTERKLRDTACDDAVENLNIINISLPVTPNDIYIMELNDIDSPANNSNRDEQIDNVSPLNVVSLDRMETVIDHDISVLSQMSIPSAGTTTLTDEEKHLIPLIELFTENTGPPASSLYRCTECNASFLHFKLWEKHISVRHKIQNTVPCPYCSKIFPIELAITHFETHRRHEYICFHCVKSFCSRENIIQHFATFHPNFRSTIEKKIAHGDASLSIFKEKDLSSKIVDWRSLFNELCDSLRHQLEIKLIQNQHKEWLNALNTSSIEDIEIPQYIINCQPRYKCLVRSCLFVGSNEDLLDLHMDQHKAPDKYSCSHCALTQPNPNWNSIKNHKMLHKHELYMCCVCKFCHHNFGGICQHIEKFHNSRDVPVIRLWRNDKYYKTSLSIVLPENKINLSTSDICFCCLKLMKKKLVHHLKKEHKITLCPKCIECDKVIFTQLDAEAHAKEHQSKSYKLKFEILTPFLYTVIVKSIFPFTLETRLCKEKPKSEELLTTTSNKIKSNDEFSVEIKKEVEIKTEPYDLTNEVADKPQCGLIKCVNLENLMQDGSCNLIKQPKITVLPISSLTSEKHQPTHQQVQLVRQNASKNFEMISMINTTPYTPEIFIDNQLPTASGLQNVNYNLNEQIEINSSEYNLPELIPVCGICSLECPDFVLLKVHFTSEHALKRERFLFRVIRRVECFYCNFRCSLATLGLHHEQNHANRLQMCRSIIDRNRCGVCHEIFNNSPFFITQKIPTCACPRRQRTLADCLDFNTLSLLQSFGENHLKYSCDICKITYNDDKTCRQHIVQIHKKATYPKQINLEMLFVCFSCNLADTSIERIINHIHETHLCSKGEREMFVTWLSFYKKIKIIFRRGFTLNAGDLKHIQYSHDEESFKKGILESEVK